MFARKLQSLTEEHGLTDPAADYRSAKKVGKYKVSAKAIYRPDGKYLPGAAVSGVVQDKGTVHVTGCCIGCVPVDRLVMTAENQPFVFEFDSEKQVLRVREILGI